MDLCELNEKITASPVLSDSDAGDEKFIFSQLQKQVHEIIESLPPKCKVVFTLSRFEEMSNQQIADHLSISVKTVENQMTKALRVFRSRLLPYIIILPILINTILNYA